MKTHLYPVFLFLALVHASASLLLAETEESALTADEIIQKNISKNVVDSEIEFVTIVTDDGQGNISRHAILFCTQKNETGFFDYLIRVVSPVQYEGVGLLARQLEADKIERFFYLPALGKVRKIMGEGGAQNFLGSNFTYEDLVKEAPGSYNYTRLPDANLDGAPCYVVRAQPKPDATEEKDGSTAATFRDLYIDKTHFNVLKIDFINEGSDKPARSLRAYDYNSIKVDGPTMRPLRAEMRDHEAGSVSWLTVIRSRFNEKIDPVLFTPEGLSSWDKEQKELILSSLNTPAR